MRDDDEFNEPYLPARYKEVVRKKKQRRLLKKIAILAIAVIAIIVVFILASGIFGGSPQPSPAPTTSPSPEATLVTTPSATKTTTTAAQVIQTTIAAPATMKTPVPTTAILKPDTVAIITTTETPEPILTARAAVITTQKTDGPKITEKEAQAIAVVAFPNLPAGRTSVDLATDPVFGQVWKFTLQAGTTTEASGLIDAQSGTVVAFNRTIHPGGRPQNPVLTMGNARQIADSTINDRNTGILSINMSDGRYIPLSTPGGNVAGTYRFVFDRIIQDYPCDNDGFIVSIDSVSGAVTEWEQRWESPDNAFMILDTPTVPKYDAIYAVQAKAKTIYPSSISSLQVVSAERVWKDGHAPGVTPRPSSIPLAWKVVFTDETIRANPDILKPGVGWVDTYTGEIIDISYPH
ncbi:MULTISPECIES: hypothetical protein [unclassified Methanoregula]|uniref:hypothetical protein n=1 Tax=unclassified Methanoregula TaxID=2649730 RepID=UPI0009D23C44|nr:MULTISPECIES: hypothetical protein [unclassified Methanoregula]OPX63351.1 MAG: Peptidase propeptide and YPEB domain protein [Methanoregula sp. PtaB.Bin085]OPY35045.1 MAG: Peptidase propeptide and YPEB domain protein [Methanoregula sp. PtaU1.Bin006]